jgi:hypothetical protein
MAAGCDDLLDALDDHDALNDHDGGAASQAETPPAAQVAGRWTLRGEGSLSGCEQPRFDTAHFELSALQLHVDQTEDERLTLASPPARGADQFHWVAGQVTADRISFSTREETRDGDIELFFEGRVEADAFFEGRFTGEGPAGCRSRGRFDVRVD